MKSLIAIVAALMLSNAAIADDEYHKGKDQAQAMKDADTKFKKLDRDDDAQLSKSEASRDDALSAEFASVDQDADGLISKSEFTAQLDKKSPPRSNWDESPR